MPRDQAVELIPRHEIEHLLLLLGEHRGFAIEGMAGIECARDSGDQSENRAAERIPTSNWDSWLSLVGNPAPASGAANTLGLAEVVGTTTRRHWIGDQSCGLDSPVPGIARSMSTTSDACLPTATNGGLTTVHRRDDVQSSCRRPRDSSPHARLWSSHDDHADHVSAPQSEPHGRFLSRCRLDGRSPPKLRSRDPRIRVSPMPALRRRGRNPGRCR